MVRIGAATPVLIKSIVDFYTELDVDGHGLESDDLASNVFVFTRFLMHCCDS